MGRWLTLFPTNDRIKRNAEGKWDTARRHEYKENSHKVKIYFSKSGRVDEGLFTHVVVRRGGKAISKPRKIQKPLPVAELKILLLLSIQRSQNEALTSCSHKIFFYLMKGSPSSKHKVRWKHHKGLPPRRDKKMGSWEAKKQEQKRWPWDSMLLQPMMHQLHPCKSRDKGWQSVSFRSRLALFMNGRLFVANMGLLKWRVRYESVLLLQHVEFFGRNHRISFVLWYNNASSCV